MPAMTDRAKSSFLSLSTLLQSEAMQKKIALALPRHMTPERLIRIALSAASRSPLLLECSQESIALSLIRAAEMGVEPDGWEAHLVPFSNSKRGGVKEASLIVDYKGLVKLAYQSELVVELDAGVVRANDQFKYKKGTDAFLDHTPADTSPPGDMTHAWAMAKIKNGGNPFVVLNKREVMEHKKASQSANSTYSPWNNPETEPSMWQKTAVRVLCKLLPRSATLHQALREEEDLDLHGEIIDITAEVSVDHPQEESKSEKLRKQLTKQMQTDSGSATAPESPTDYHHVRDRLEACKTYRDALVVYDELCGPESTLSNEDREWASGVCQERMNALKQGKLV